MLLNIVPKKKDIKLNSFVKLCNKGALRGSKGTFAPLGSFEEGGKSKRKSVD